MIPAFAVGRTQELLYYIKRMLIEGTVPGLERVPVYLDSPLGIKATRIYENCTKENYDQEALEMSREGDLFEFPTLRIAQTAEESKQINTQPGCNIIISSSGMCDAGRIRHHLKHNLYRADSTIVFAGYQAVGTLGRPAGGWGEAGQNVWRAGDRKRQYRADLRLFRPCRPR